MNPLMAGLMSGGASLIGSIFSSETSAQNTQAQIQASQQQQATQNAFTESMSNSAYQRASKDMTAAGLNPAMMFGSGSAASTPSGSSIQAPMPQNKNPLADLGSSVSKGIDAMVSAKTVDKMAEEISNLKATEARTEAETLTERNRPAQVATETSARAAQRHLTNVEAKNEEIKSQVYGNEATRAANEREERETPAGRLSDKAAMYGRNVSHVLEPLGTAVNSALSTRRLFNDRFGHW